MKCPSCQAECADKAEACFTCGKALFALTQGSLLAGRYEVVSPLGKGGMSRVYKAYDRILGEPVAIKVLRAELAWEPEMRQRFLHEIRLARRVSHPNVCRIHEYGEDGPLRYISMEIVEGINLKDALRNRGLSTDEAFDVVLQMCEGLIAVHQHGIVHRDFKASNLMLDRQGLAKLMDFGIAKLMESETSSLTTPGQVLGTPEYMSPEHAGGGRVDFRSDIYALGCVMFEIFTGQAPFRGPNAFATMSKHFYEPVPLDGPLATLIPEALVPVLRKSLAKEPERRQASVAELRDEVRAARTSAVVAEEAEDATRPGSPRLRAVCEALLAMGPTLAAHEPSGSYASGSSSASGEEAAQGPETKTTARPSSSAQPAADPARPDLAPGPVVAAPPATVKRLRPRVRRSLVAAALTAMVGAGALAAWSVLTHPANGAEHVAAVAAPAQLLLPTPAPSAAVVVTAAEVPAAERAPDQDRPRSRREPETTPAVRAPAAQVPAPAPSVPAGGPVTSVERPPAAAARRAPTGTLRLLIVPWGEVLVDGISLGTVSLRDVPLAAGAHTVQVLHPDYQPLQRKVTVAAGEQELLVVDLSEKGIRRTP